MPERVSRGHVTFDASCPNVFESLVSETLGTSEFIEVEHMDDGLVIHEVDPEDRLSETPENAVALADGRTPEQVEQIREEVDE